MNGCSKRKSHPILPDFRRMELHAKFPLMPYGQGRRIIQQFKLGWANSSTHRCHDTWLRFRNCVSLKPQRFVERCQVQAALHLDCLKMHGHGKADEARTVHFRRFLERFRVFDEKYYKNKKYADPTVNSHGEGTVFQFTSASSNPLGGGAW
ncbi:conserved hypothetical protein [Perkinsus marinus ATCC 50983]|uniref:Uncharacterized protein n=1 Tax=Perkinsus marinus (strain ATCC 50983 / TXsc) TaxID=423536 RepID=C5KCY7_PERM5|nr:conserved hypothetical protein [Perkinsus marinus ATCC 50983]EER17736.1 conserved hypothetical protein [Perkinsus marinus ATCC 50983]|eukprot:XP_002785940.1 conserved hypothetical protein [Perkinsus marinus ATCC 50983]